MTILVKVRLLSVNHLKEGHLMCSVPPGMQVVHLVGSGCTSWGAGGVPSIEKGCFPCQVLLDLQAEASGALERNYGICQGPFA